MVVNTSLFFNASGLIKDQVVFINETLDFFEDIFDEPISNWVMISLYFIGIPAVAGIFVVTWMERTDQVGPYRTLLNQLTGFGLETVGFSKYQRTFLSTSKGKECMHI